MKTLAKYIIAFAVMVSSFCLLQWTAYAIPEKWTKDNIEESLQLLSKEGKFPRLWGNILWAKDNCTDGSMYNIAVSAYDMTPLEGMIINPRTGDDFSVTLTSDYGLYAINHQNNADTHRLPYGRYWHGYMFPLKIASIFMSLKWLRVVNIVLLSSLLLITGIMIGRRNGLLMGIGWIATFVVVGFEVVPLSLQYVGCYYIMFISILLMLHYPNLNTNGMFYFVIGGWTSYVDFLTVPVLTIGIPLVIATIDSRKRITYGQLIGLAISWGAGYALVWSFKWVIAMLYLGADFNHSLFFNGGHTIFSVASGGYEHKYFGITSFLLSLALIIDVIFFIFIQRKSNRYLSTRLFWISLLPFVWYLAMFMHSVNHIWFVYRALTVTVFSCVATAASCRQSLTPQQKWDSFFNHN